MRSETIDPERLREASRACYKQSINQVIDHVDRNLDLDLPLSELASVAGFSEFHFHRVFRCLTGETVVEFITRMRLERALWRMRHAPASLTEIAIDCGFGSLSNFSRTFKKHYGISPGKIKIEPFLQERKIGQAHPLASRYYLNEFPEDEPAMDFPVRIVQRADQHIAYIRCQGLYLDPNQGIEAYKRLMEWARVENRMNPETKVIGMSGDDPDVTPLAKCRYDLCVTVDAPIRPSGEIGAGIILGGRYAVHHCQGDIHAFVRAWTHFFMVWFPQSGHRPASRPAMEIYHSNPEEVGWEYFDIDCCVPIDPIPGLIDL